jgi:2-oxoacid:acceptor oxidoreductase delta subunit (pyruvate/2-ketoisovalerate family)
MFNIPKEREVPFAGVTPGPVGEQPMMITGNWRTYRPVIDQEKCNLCMNCVVFCPDACWQLNEAEEEVVWNAKYCKGCLLCVNECTTEALTKAYELDFEDGVVRLEKLF